MLEVKIGGLRELEKALGELAEKLARNVVRGGLRQAAKVIAKQAQLNAPRSSGRLADSIGYSSGVKGGVPYGRVTAGGSDAFYAHMVEFGTAAHALAAPDRPGRMTRRGYRQYSLTTLNRSLQRGGMAEETIRATAMHPGAQARPFMRPAMDTHALEATLAFAEYVRKRLTKEGIEAPEVFPEDQQGDEE